MKNTERFSGRAEHYIKYRPHYPHAIITCLEQEACLTKGSMVADIGAGTGISCMPFLENGNTVFAVEPNSDMRDASERLLRGFPGFHAVAGTAEKTTLPDASADLIVAAQAFHWFHGSAARSEFLRIGKPGACTVLMWNERDLQDELGKAYEALLQKYAVDYRETNHRNVGPAQLSAFFSPAVYRAHVFRNAQQLDLQGLKGRLLSASYAPQPGHALYAPMMSELEELFARYAHNGMVKFMYTTRLYIGKLE
ncbi:class I SAM-dependent methyltransferase [Chitinophaga sp. NPDC101104]|uniref:class I SAM-dependent methyltransferase n=1 Tax=Chitinophaga sp. NPDC101104 TaxID=3390561 RepID=UPI003D012988